MLLSKLGIKELSDAVFAFENAFVVEAYSDFDKKPLSFRCSQKLQDYIESKTIIPNGIAYLFVVYPDMKGNATIKKINLDAKKVPQHKFRYTWEGWGLISVQIASPQLGLQSNVDANSEKRAIKWAETYPEWELPSTWNWQAVNKHKNRLKRVLKKHA